MGVVIIAGSEHSVTSLLFVLTPSNRPAGSFAVLPSDVLGDHGPIAVAVAGFDRPGKALAHRTCPGGSMPACSASARA